MRRLAKLFARRDLLIIAGLFVLPLAFFWQVTLGPSTLLPADNLYQFQPWAAYREQQGVPAVPHNSLLSDLVLENLPWKQFIRQSISNHELPLWNPYIFAGVPFLAAGQSSALYPFSVIYYVLPLDKAYGWFTVSQLWLAGALMFLFLRGLRVSRFGATLGAVAYQLSGFFLASVVFQMIIAAAAWLPFLLLMVEWTIQQRVLFGKRTVIPWIALGALGLGCEILAGHVEFTLYALLVMGFWSVCRLGYMAWQGWRLGKVRAELRQMLKPAFALLALVLLGIGIGSVQFIPTLELASHNFREGSTTFDQVRSYAFPPRHALAFLMPNLFGTPAQHDYIDVFSGHQEAFSWQRGDSSTVTDTYWEVGKNYVEGACYVGLLTLILAAIALLNGRFEKTVEARLETAGPYRGIFAALSILSLLFVFGTPVYALLYYGLPGINQLHSPFRWVFPLTLCLAALAGFGADALQRASIAAVGFTFRLAKRLGYALILLGAAVLLLLLLSRVFFERLRGPLDALFHKLAGADSAFPNVATFYSVEFIPILVFGLFLTACGVVVYLSRRSNGKLQRVWQALALLTLTLDLVVASVGFNPAADPQWLAFTPPAITWLQQHDPSQWRFTAVEGPTHTMNANVGWLYGLQDVRGYDSIIPKQYADYMGQIAPQGQLIYNRIAPIEQDDLKALDSPYLDLLSVKYVLAENPIDTAAHPQYTLVYPTGNVTDHSIYIYENSRALPRAYVADSTTLNPLAADIGSASIIENGNIQVSVNVSTRNTQSMLVLADSYFPGWRAYVRPQGTAEDEEKEVPVQLVGGNYRGVALQPGAWTVRFRYSPPSFQLGAFVTFIAAVMIVFALLIWLWGLFYTEGEGSASGVRRVAKNSIAPIALNLFNRGIDFAFAAIMLRVIGPVDAGVYYYAIVIWGWFDTITNFGLNILLTREVSRDHSQAGRYLLNSSVLRILLAAAGVPFLVIFLAINYAIRPPSLTVEQFQLAVGAIFLLYIGLVPNSISYGLTGLFYAFEKAEIPAATSTVSAILKAVLGLGALLAGWGVLGLAGVSIALNLITLAILGIQTRSLLRKHAAKAEKSAEPPPASGIDRRLIRDMVIASWPLMLNNLLAGLFFKIDVTLLEPMKGSLVVGQYSTAYKWIDALGIIPSLFTMALLPIMSRQAKEDHAGLQRNYHFAVKLLVGLALPVAVMITFLAPTLIGALGGANYLPDGAIALQLMIWFAPIGWINSLTNYLLIALDQQRAMRWAFIAGVTFNIVTNLIFIPLASYKAAAVITIFSELVLLIAFYRLLRKALAPVPWFALLWKLAAAAGVMLAAIGLLWNFAPLLALLAGVVAYPVALHFLRPFSAWEVERIATLLPGSVRGVVIATLPTVPGAVE